MVSTGHRNTVIGEVFDARSETSTTTNNGSGARQNLEPVASWDLVHGAGEASATQPSDSLERDQPRPASARIGSPAFVVAGPSSSRQLSARRFRAVSRRVCAIRAIARLLSRFPSTISREINQNGGCRKYRAADAERRACSEARRPKQCKLALNAKLRCLVARRLRRRVVAAADRRVAQAAISGGLGMQVSHETIYRSCSSRRAGRSRRAVDAPAHTAAMRRRAVQVTAERRGQIIRRDGSIRERPAEAEDRAVPGHWEGDLFVGTQRSSSPPWWNARRAT